MLGALRLAELVAARVCHDVAGLAGSVSQMLALLEADEEALNTAKDANARMIRQLRVLRLAFTAGEISVSPTDLADMFADRPIGVLFDVPIGTVFLAPTARVLANVLLIAEAGLPQGGTVSVAGTPDALVVQLNGTAARWQIGRAHV